MFDANSRMLSLKLEEFADDSYTARHYWSLDADTTEPLFDSISVRNEACSTPQLPLISGLESSYAMSRQPACSTLLVKSEPTDDEITQSNTGPTPTSCGSPCTTPISSFLVPTPQSLSRSSATAQHASSNAGHRKWHKYHMQRLQTTANHVLFYVVDAANQAQLAIIGTDVRLSGHFVYCTLPDFKGGPPVRCTNRNRVMEWLSALGATDSADPNQVQVPPISHAQLDMLLSSDPMFSKPELDREYSSWREEGGKLPDGRHFKSFYLIDDVSRMEKLVVTAEDSQRKDRRYAYKATPDMGGFAFENGQAVKEWLDFVVGRTTSASTRSFTKTRASQALSNPAKVPKISHSHGPSSNTTDYCNDTYVAYHSQHPTDSSATNNRQGKADYLQSLHQHALASCRAATNQPEASLSLQTETAGHTLEKDDDWPSHWCDAAPDVIDALDSDDDSFLEWVCSTPSLASVAKMHMWCNRLDDASQKLMIGSQGQKQPWPPSSQQTIRDLALADILETLAELKRQPMSMRLLELTKVAGVVASLTTHGHPEIRRQAQHVHDLWWNVAISVAARVNAALTDKQSTC